MIQSCLYCSIEKQKEGNGDKPLWDLRVDGAFGAVGIGTGAWVVLSSIPVG